jgi:hypothetical protein
MFQRYLLLALLLSVVGCGKSTSNAPAESEQTLIQGELTQESFNEAAKKELAEAQAALVDPALTEETLDQHLTRIEELSSLSNKINVDKSKLSEAELVSTLGSLYVRKAGFHAKNGAQAGALAASGFRDLDRAIAKYPDNMTARINRGMTCANVPEFMNKSEVARDDLRFVVGSPEFANLGPDQQAQVKSLLRDVEGRLARSDVQK